jgi:hypothetical protein
LTCSEEVVEDILNDSSKNFVGFSFFFVQLNFLKTVNLKDFDLEK